MTRSLLVSALALCVTVPTGAGSDGRTVRALAQNEPLTSTDLVRLIGNETDARRVVQFVLAAVSLGRAFVLASQVRQTWLPTARPELVRLPDGEVERHLAMCGRYWLLSDVVRHDNVVTMNVTERCGCSLRAFVISLEEGDWHLGPPHDAARRWSEGIGSGCFGVPPGCPCFGR